MRAQTTLDFVIGVTVFLTVILFAFSFVPGILEPFELGNDEHPKLSDRVADSLAEEKLGSPDNPYVLDRYCTVAFFDNPSTGASDCNYSGGTLEEMFELKSFQNVNITLEGNVTDHNGEEIVCWTEDNEESVPGLVEQSRSECNPSSTTDQVLKIGDNPPGDSSATITARRVVLLGGDVVTLKVILW